MPFLQVPPNLTHGTDLKKSIENLPPGDELTVDLSHNAPTWVAGTVLEFAHKRGFKVFTFTNSGGPDELPQFLPTAEKRYGVSAKIGARGGGLVDEAQAAYEAGHSLYQCQIPLDVQSARAAIGRVEQTSVSLGSAGEILTAIEAVGWTLEHAGVAFRPTGTVSRDRFLASGQQESVAGSMMNVYVFRRVAKTPDQS